MVIKFVTPFAILGLLSGNAFAQSCTPPSSRLNATQITNLVKGKYVCGMIGTEKWDELHTGGVTGTVTDYKLGPTDKNDPSKEVGNYSIGGNGNNVQITYTYGSTSFSYYVSPVAGSTTQYSFCGAGNAPTLFVTIQSGHCF